MDGEGSSVDDDLLIRQPLVRFTSTGSELDDGVMVDRRWRAGAGEEDLGAARGRSRPSYSLRVVEVNWVAGSVTVSSELPSSLLVSGLVEELGGSQLQSMG